MGSDTVCIYNETCIPFEKCLASVAIEAQQNALLGLPGDLLVGVIENHVRQSTHFFDVQASSPKTLHPGEDVVPRISLLCCLTGSDAEGGRKAMS